MLTTIEIQEQIKKLKTKLYSITSHNTVDHQVHVIDYTNGDRYEGEVLVCDEKMIRHGDGSHSCSNGDTYKGGWLYDYRHGHGKIEFCTGVISCYDGEWSDDQTNGQGSCQYRDGSFYEGEFLNDQRNGWGIYRTNNNEHYEGEWKDDTPNGNGKWTMVDGSYLEGMFQNGVILEGKHINKTDKTEYNGCFKNGFPHGHGTFTFQGQWTYQGAFQEGKKSGQGICEWLDGSRYDGAWLNDRRHGKGKLSFHGQLVYEGDWKDDQKHGHGILIEGNGHKYKGNFAQDEKHGEGVMLYSNGDCYKGGWNRNKRHGLGKCVYHTGDKYKGEWKDDVREGSGTCQFSDGVKFTGRWKNDCWVQTAASPNHTCITGEGLSQAVAGHPTTLTIEARDEDGQPRLSGGDPVSLLLVNQKDLSYPGTVKDNQDGTYAANYNVHVSGMYDLYVFIGEEPTINSPYSVNIVADVPHLKQSIIEMPQKRVFAQGEQIEFYVSPRDCYGNECGYEDVNGKFPVEVHLEGQSGEQPVSVDLGIDGRYHCVFQCAISGNYRLFVTSNNKHLQSSPKSIQIGNVDDLNYSVEDQLAKWKLLDDPDSDKSESEALDPEQAFIKAHPEIPVVTDLEDLWKLNKLQRDRVKHKHT